MAFEKWKQMFKKQYTFSQLQPSWKNNTPVWNDWTTENAIKYGYKSSTYVYACINAIAKASASVPWQTYTKKRNGAWEEIQDHPLTALIEKPNPFMTRKDLIERMTINLYLGGNSYFTKVRAGGTVAELWALPTDAMKVVPHRTKFIDHYLYEAGEIKQQIKPNDIIHNMFIDPSNPYVGMSPMQAGAKVIDTDVEAVTWNKVSLQNRAITDGIFSFDQTLTRDQWEEARAMVREQHQGMENGRTPWILGAGAQWTQMSLSPAEMDFIESRRFTRSEICSIFQVPPPIVGVYDDATLANIETARKIFWLDTIIPYLEDIKSCLNGALAHEFGGVIELDYDVSNVEAIQTNLTDKLNNAKTLWSMGVPFNDINQRLELGFDDIEGGDVGYLATSLVPADMMDEPATEEAPAVDDPPPANEEDQTDETDQTDDENDDSGTLTGDEEEAPAKRLFKSSGVIAEHTKGINLKSDEHKEFYFKAVERRRAMWYLASTRKASQLFKSEGLTVANLVKQGKIDEALAHIDKNEKAWISWLEKTWQTIVEEVGAETFDNLKSYRSFETKDAGDYFNPFAQLIQRYIKRTVGDKIKNVSKTTKKAVKKVIHDIRAEDGSLDDIAKGIKEKYQDFSRYRAYRIARTEVVGASNFASVESAKQSGVVTMKEWISSKDDRVRESHEDLHGKTAPLDGKFANGLAFPADYSANKPSETIHCRCTIAYTTE
jgi:HK97 family phage portal protein